MAHKLNRPLYVLFTTCVFSLASSFAAAQTPETTPPTSTNAAKPSVDLPAFPVAPSPPAAQQVTPANPQPTPATGATPAQPSMPAPPIAAQPAVPPHPLLATTRHVDPDAKYPDYLAAPLHMDVKSMLFSEKDMSVIMQLLHIYDTTSVEKKTAAPSGDDLNDLLKQLTAKHSAVESPATPQPVYVLPNVYLASIVYYTPSNWSVWINDKKLVNIQNMPTNEFYISRLSRTQAEIVWKPQSLTNAGQHWKERTENGKKPLENITVDSDKGTITLLLRPGQTFVSRTLAIQEGLVKSSPNAGVTYEEHEEKGTWK